MKLASWLCFLAVALAAFAASGWLWVSRDIADAVFAGTPARPYPPITQLMFAAQPWFPLASLPWLAVALTLSLRTPVAASAFCIYAASCLLGCVLLAALALVPSVLPYKEIIVRMPQR